MGKRETTQNDTVKWHSAALRALKWGRGEKVGAAARRERGFLPGGKRRVMLEEQKSQTLINYNAQPHGIMRFVLFDKFETQ